MSISGITRARLQACGRETFNTNNCRTCEPTCQGGGDMAPILTAEEVVRRIAVECAYVDERGGVGRSVNSSEVFTPPSIGAVRAALSGPNQRNTRSVA